MAACIWPGTWRDPGGALPWWSAVGLAGSCPNINCLPSKNEIWSAKVADLVHHGASFGAKTDAAPIDMAKVRQRKRDMVKGEVAAVLRQYESSGADLIMGTGHF